MGIRANIDGKLVDIPCGHGRSQIFPKHFPSALFLSHGWFRSHIRCFDCDLKEDVGWRWKFKTQGDGFAVWKRRYECHFGGPATGACWNIGACGCRSLPEYQD